jgi:hypothetical protein
VFHAFSGSGIPFAAIVTSSMPEWYTSDLDVPHEPKNGS